MKTKQKKKHVGEDKQNQQSDINKKNQKLSAMMTGKHVSQQATATRLAE